jgi:hypothetical protein
MFSTEAARPETSTAPVISANVPERQPTGDSERFQLLLDFAYRHAFERDHQEQRLMRLFTKFGFLYGKYVHHETLRHAICAYTAYWTRSASTTEQQYYGARAIEILLSKLKRPDQIDAGDLFASALLAMWASLHRNDKEFAINTGGFLAILDSLSISTEVSADMKVLWSLIKGELILHAYDRFNLKFSRVDTFTRELCRMSPRNTGDEVFRERQSYHSLLGRGTLLDVSVDGLLVTVWEQLFLLRRCFLESRGESGDDVETVLMIVQDRLAPYQDEQIWERYLEERSRNKDTTNANDGIYLDAATAIVCLLLCRLLSVILERHPIPQSTIITFTHRVELVAFNNETFTIYDDNVKMQEWVITDRVRNGICSSGASFQCH